MFSAAMFAAGLFVGWFFLPAPQFAKDLRDWLIAKVPFLSPFQRADT